MATLEEALNAAIGLYHAGRFADVKALCERILEVAGDHPDALHLSGMAERQEGNLERAVDLLRRAISVRPDFLPLHVNLGNTLRAACRTAEATRSYRNAAAVAPDELTAWHGLGNFLTTEGGSGARAEAIRSLRHAAAIAPDTADVQHDLGLVLRYAERVEEGIVHLRQAVAARADHRLAWMNLGTALVETGEHDRAVASLRRAVALAPDAPEMHYNLGNALHARGDLEEALAAFRRAVRLGLAMAQVRIGMTLHDLGRLDEAEAAFRLCLDQEGTDVPTATERLARIFVERNRTEAGRALFVGLLPSSPVGRRFRGECLTALADLDLHDGQTERAAALLAPVRGDNSRFFTVKSIAAFRLTLDRLGATLVRPANAHPERPAVTSSTLASYGRFAHNALEYMLVRLYAEKHGCVLETPEWVGGYFFAVDDPLPSRPYRPFYYPRKPLNAGLAGRSGTVPAGDIDFRSPLFLMEHKEEYRERVQSWLRPRPVWSPFLDPSLERLRERGDTVVAVHIRRGDFVQFNYPITETAWYVRWLRELWPTLKRPVLYVASDDIDGVRADFAEFAPLTRADVTDPWENLEFLQDFHVLMHADVVGVSTASGYSLLAARLNRRARLFAEPDMADRRIRPFNPWVP